MQNNKYDAMLPVDYKKAFKDADIRGWYGSEIDEIVAYRVAQAFVVEFSLSQVLVGRDMRLSSPALRDAFVAGVVSAGATVIDLGLVTTPMLYFASGSQSLPGVMITASHNPAGYNGLKLIMPGAIPLTNATGLKAIEQHIAKTILVTSKTRGNVTKKSIVAAYSRFVRDTVTFKPTHPLQLVVDAGNGMGTLLGPILKTYSKLTTTELFFALDGAFPNRASNPTLHKNQKQVRAELKKGIYDFGVAFDGDADRVAFFDERGRSINAAVIGSLLSRYFLGTYPNATCVDTVLTSRGYRESILAGGGKVRRARVGHAFIKEVMRAHDVVFACEHSGHFYYRDTFFADSGIVTVLLVAKLIDEAKRGGQTFSQLLSPFKFYYQTEEVLVPVRNKRETLAAVRARAVSLNSKKISVFDGLTIDMGNYWYTVKESVTEDALKFVVESKQQKVAQVAQTDLLAFLEPYRSGCTV